MLKAAWQQLQDSSILEMNKAPLDWLLKVVGMVEMGKLSALIKDSALTNLRTIWKPYLTFCQTGEKMN